MGLERRFLSSNFCRRWVNRIPSRVGSRRIGSSNDGWDFSKRQVQLGSSAKGKRWTVGHSNFNKVFQPGIDIRNSKVSPSQSSHLEFSLNRRQMFRMQSKVFFLFNSHYHQNFCITEMGNRSYHVWFGLEDMKWLIEIFPTFNMRKPWSITRFDKTHNRKFTASFGSNRWGSYIRIIGSCADRSNSILVPTDRDGLHVFLTAIDSFFDKSLTALSSVQPDARCENWAASSIDAGHSKVVAPDPLPL
ncbi:hypothetical protein DM860_009153 [Cuscuta australis]|uniref:Uncharacterized protein n=1 Tax=Cuscuta australis TaxID=267555 RepID=A0A328DAZ4_9ASTE|nr:hypothetical protein DM860_009153 [Cuscuta australis]